MAANPHPSRDEIEDQWRERVKAARTQYEFAMAEFRKLLADLKDCPLPAPDGSAMRRESISSAIQASPEYGPRVLAHSAKVPIPSPVPKPTAVGMQHIHGISGFANLNPFGENGKRGGYVFWRTA